MRDAGYLAVAPRLPSLLQQACSLVGHAFGRGYRGTITYSSSIFSQPVSTGFRGWSAFRRLDFYLRDAFQPILDAPCSVKLALPLDVIDDPRQVALAERHNAISGLPCQSAGAARAVVDVMGGGPLDVADPIGDLDSRWQADG